MRFVIRITQPAIASALRPPALACYFTTCCGRTGEPHASPRGEDVPLPARWRRWKRTGYELRNPLPWSSPAQTNQRAREEVLDWRGGVPSALVSRLSRSAGPGVGADEGLAAVMPGPVFNCPPPMLAPCARSPPPSSPPSLPSPSLSPPPSLSFASVDHPSHLGLFSGSTSPSALGAT